ncbi:hypothetical protein FXO38_07995 [Capsicum annuum]|nr:hypothetical protein FXO38_07995 [Capsicum annuum]
MTPQCSKLINKYDRTRFIFYDANELDKEEMGHHLIEECRLALTEADGKQIRLVLASIEPLRWITGHTIFFAPCVINSLYEIPELDNTYLYILLRDPTWNEINPDLCPLGIELHFDTHGQRDWLTAKSLSLVTKDVDFNFPAGNVNSQPSLHEDHTLHGVIVAENVSYPGIQ